MNKPKPKYSIGDCIDKTGLIIRGIMTLQSGSHRYFIQVNKSDNSIVMNEEDIDNHIELIFKEISKDVNSA